MVRAAKNLKSKLDQKFFEDNFMRKEIDLSYKLRNMEYIQVIV